MYEEGMFDRVIADVVGRQLTPLVGLRSFLIPEVRRVNECGTID